MHWKSRSWILIGVLLAALTAAHAQIVTTQVADIIYHADGTPATGTALISWPAFTTSNGDVVPPGSISATIAANGALSVQLTPNADATPLGAYYTVVYHLDDGSVARQYWVVPVSSVPVRISAIESTVLPTSVAMQTVSKSYVDTAIETAVTGHPLDSNPFTLKAGDTMTGPLILPADPVSANQAADKNYVDETVAASAGGLGQKFSLGGDIDGTAAAAVVTGIQGKPVSATAPAVGQTLTWDGTAYVPTSDDDLSSPPAIGNTTGAPSLAVNASNYPATGWDTYSAVNFGCGQNLLPADNGSTYPTSFCMDTNYNDWYPGMDIGSPGTLSDVGWYLPYAFELSVNSKSDGIRVAQQIDATYTGSGDTVLLNLNANSKEAVISGSTEGLHVVREDLQELYDYGGTVATGGTGSTALTLNIGSNGGSLGLNSPLLDLNSRMSCTLTATGTENGSVMGNFSGVVSVATTSCTLPVSDAGTLASNIDIPRIYPNTTGQISHRTGTVTLNTTADLSLLPSPIVCSIMGPNLYETIGNATFGAYNSSAHTQTVTANFFYSHTAGAQFFCGGAAGMYFDQTSEEPGTDNLYLVRIYGSTSANTVWVGNEVAVGFSGSNLQAGAQAGNLYKGGDVVGVLDPANGTPDGTYAAIMPNTAPWAPGDSVENANNISANYYSYYDNAVVNNPFATRVMHYENWFGYGGGAGASSGWGYFSNDAGNNYVGAGGKFYAPYLLGAQGYISEGLFSQYAPLTGPQSVASLGCAPGFMIAICNGPAPGATTTVEGIFQPDGNHGDEFVYDHATRAWEFVGPGGAVLNGSPICTGGGSCSLLSIAPSGTTNGTISFGGNAGADALDLFAYGSNKYGWGLNGGEMQFFVQDDTTDHFSFSGAAGGLQPTGTNEFARLTPRTSGGGWSLASGEGYGWSSSATSSATVATQFTQPSAGNVSLDTTTPGNHAASLTLNNLTVDGVYLGPAMAPTGPCPTNGAWVFSQDGHATFCAAGAWTAKI